MAISSAVQKIQGVQLATFKQCDPMQSDRQYNTIKNGLARWFQRDHTKEKKYLSTDATKSAHMASERLKKKNIALLQRILVPPIPCSHGSAPRVRTSCTFPRVQSSTSAHLFTGTFDKHLPMHTNFKTATATPVSSTDEPNHHNSWLNARDD